MLYIIRAKTFSVMTTERKIRRLAATRSGVWQDSLVGRGGHQLLVPLSVDLRGSFTCHWDFQCVVPVRGGALDRARNF